MRCRLGTQPVDETNTRIVIGQRLSERRNELTSRHTALEKIRDLHRRKRPEHLGKLRTRDIDQMVRWRLIEDTRSLAIRLKHGMRIARKVVGLANGEARKIGLGHSLGTGKRPRRTGRRIKIQPMRRSSSARRIGLKRDRIKTKRNGYRRSRRLIDNARCPILLSSQRARQRIAVNPRIETRDGTWSGVGNGRRKRGINAMRNTRIKATINR